MIPINVVAPGLARNGWSLQGLVPIFAAVEGQNRLAAIGN
jgi:hypothetical protein